MFKMRNRISIRQPLSKNQPRFSLEASRVMKRARIAVDCRSEIRRIIWPLKADFPYQSEGIFKQYTEELLILAHVGLVFLYNLNEIPTSDVLELVSCDRAEWA